jgi:uncharacterized protein
MHLPDEPAPRWGIGDVLIGMAAWLAASFLFALPGVLVALSELPEGASPEDIRISGLWSVFALVGSWAALLVVLLYASRRKGFGTFARDFGFRFRWIDPLIGFGAGFATLIVTGTIGQIVADWVDEDPAGNAEAIFAGQEANTVGLVALALAAAIGAPIVEELFFRGLALRAIERRYGGVVGVIGSTVLFTLPHFQGGTPASIATLFGIIGSYAVVFALLARFFGRLGPSIFAHMTVNGIGVSLLVYTTLYP